MSAVSTIKGVPATHLYPPERPVLDERQRRFEAIDRDMKASETANAGADYTQRLQVIFGDQLPQTFEPPDELVQGILTTGGASMLYGASNSGKTFLATDLAFSVARGADWMGRKVEQGLAIYVAAESPLSIRMRLQAYQLHHECVIPDLAIVQAPLNLFSTEHDALALIGLVHQVEQDHGRKVRLIVGDTLARLSVGANENSGQDMGLVIARIDRIRADCKAHFALIHHSGKNEAYGARGWSGIKAAIDTEIEVTDGPEGHCAEVTKQRDLGGKNDRIGFRLDTIRLGQTKWGSDATTCVVAPADAPPRAKAANTRLGKVELAVLDFLAAQKAGVRKAEVKKSLEACGMNRSTIYAAMAALVEKGMAHEDVNSGLICIAEAQSPSLGESNIQFRPVSSNLDKSDKGESPSNLSSLVQTLYESGQTGQNGRPQDDLGEDF